MYLSSTELVNRTCSGQSAAYFNLRHSQPFSFIPPVDLCRILSAVTPQAYQQQCSVFFKSYTFKSCKQKGNLHQRRPRNSEQQQAKWQHETSTAAVCFLVRMAINSKKTLGKTHKITFF